MQFENGTLFDDKNFYDPDYRPYGSQDNTDLKLFASPKKIYDYLDKRLFVNQNVKEICID